MQKGRALYKHKLLTIVSLLMLMLIWSCKKEDNQPPVVNIQLPNTGNYHVFDTLRVVADISDNNRIDWVSIKIIDTKNQQVTPSYVFSTSKLSYHLECNYVIDNLYLESGNYFLLVEAYDGENTSKDYVSIRIGAVARFLEDILIVENEQSTTKVYSILDGKKLLKELDGEYQDFVYNPYAQQYLFLSKDGVLKAYDKEKLELQWQVSDLKNPNQLYGGTLIYKDKLVHVSDAYSGAIRSYDGSGNVVKQANTIDTKGEIGHFIFGNEKIMALKIPYVSGEDKIEEINEETGASVYTYDIPFSPKSLCFVDEELCLVFGNKYEEAKACSLSTLYNVIHPFGDFGTRKFGDAYKYSPYYYILSLENEIVEYDLSNGNERFLENTNAPIAFFYEDLYDKLYFVDDDKIAVLSYPDVGSQVFYKNEKKLSDLIFVYNK